MATNLPRVTQKIFGENAGQNIGQFGSALAGQGNPTGDIEEIQALPAWEGGWNSAVISERDYPPLEEMTGIQKVETQQIAYLMQKGIPEWDAGTTYFANISFCQVNGAVYQSLTDNNIGNNPTEDQTNWALWATSINANRDLSNLTATGEKHFVNKTQLTNCILEAPNGVVTYTNLTLTAKQGLKVLMPNGRNADGSLKNIEYTVAEDLTFNMSGFKNLDFILVLTQSGLAIHNPNLLEGLDSNKPNTLNTTSWTAYYATDTNIYYSSVGSTTANWVATPLIALGVGFSNETSQITSFTPLQPVSLAKEQDIDGQWVYKNLLLCDQQMTTVLNVETDLEFDLSSYLPNDDQRYEIIVNGYIFVGNSTSSSLAVYARNSEGYVNNICAARNQVVTADTNTELALGSALMIIEADRRLTLRYFATGLNGQLRNFNVKGYRKVR